MGESFKPDISIISDWGVRNRMEFNATKTKNCIISTEQNAHAQPFLLGDTLLNDEDKFSVLHIRDSKELFCNDTFSVAN